MKINGKPVIFVSFSGGRTSAFMCLWLLQEYGHKHHFIFVFANTGQEHEKTLEFVDRCDREWGLNLIWVEAVVHYGVDVGCTHKIVDFDSACRDGSLFEAMVKKYGIPNPSWPHCNRDLKINPMMSLKEDLGFKRNHKMAVGIRADEIDRMSPDSMKRGAFYPLISWRQTTKPEIRHWWAAQDFDLEIPEHLGNCKTCWKKSDRKLYTIAKHHPEYFECFDRLGDLYPDAGAGDERRVFFRKNRTAKQIIATSKQPFVEFVDYMPGWQQDLGLEIDELDIESDCGGTCEAA